MKKNVFKVTLFLCIGIAVFIFLQYIFVPKWEYPSTALETYRLAGFYNEPEDSLQVLALGTSHMFCGYSPNEVYEKFGITSYNLGTPSQPLEATYFMLKEALKTQSPTVAVCDVSSLFHDDYYAVNYRYVLDQMPFGSNKLAFAKEFAEKDEDNSILEAMLPLLRYHDRWAELKERDFTELSRNKHYFMKGYFLDAKIKSAGITTGADNDLSYVNETTDTVKKEYVNGNLSVEKIEVNYDDYYTTQMSVENMEWLFKIKKLCDEENIELLLIKVPDEYGNVFKYSGTWTEQRSSYVKELCRRYDIAFFDMTYDCDSDINWLTDTNDAGKHLNISGALKVSNILGKYLVENYHLEENWNELWNQDLLKYQQLREIALMASKENFTDYLDELVSHSDGRTIFIAAEDDVVVGMDELIKEKLRQLGLKTSFDEGFRDSYVAIIEDGDVTYEALSDDRITYNGNVADSCTYSVMSSGYYTGSDSNIKINEVNYETGGLGFNIVVYDNEAEMVIDSVRFSMHEPQKADRQNIWNRLMKYQLYLMQ